MDTPPCYSLTYGNQEFLDTLKIQLVSSDLEDPDVIDTSQSALSALDIGRKEAIETVELSNTVPLYSKISEMEFKAMRVQSETYVLEQQIFSIFPSIRT